MEGRNSHGIIPYISSLVLPTNGAGAAGPNNAALEVSFAMSGFLALILHAVGVELYLRLTPRESERLRIVSYERQLERGMKNLGSAGLVVECGCLGPEELFG